MVGPANGYFRGLDGEIRKLRALSDIQLMFEASDLRSEKTGLHARVTVQANGVALAYDTMNTERDSARTALANSAYFKLNNGHRPTKENPGRADYPPHFLLGDLDDFCKGLRDVYIADRLPGKMKGSLVRRAPRFISRPYILWDSSTIAFAPPGFGKSYVLWLMAVSVDAGGSSLWPVEQHRVLVVNLERSLKSVEDRLGNVNVVLGLGRERELDVLNARGSTLSELELAVKRYVRENDIGCVFLDSLSRAGPGSLNDDDVVNGYCNILNGLKCAWFALAHSPRADATHIFGSQMFDAAADLTVRVTQEQKLRGPMGVGLEVVKRNDIGPQPLWVGEFRFDDGGLSGVARARAGYFAEIEGSEKQTMEEKIARFLGRNGESFPTEIADNTGLNRSNVNDLLSKSDRFVRLRTVGKNTYYGLAAVVGGSITQGNTSSVNYMATHEQQVDSDGRPF